MPVLVITSPATPDQLEQMLQTWGVVSKVAVDVRRGILAGGGRSHSQGEEELLAIGSRQEDIWGASWIPLAREIRFESMVNLRPVDNRSMEILDAVVRDRVGEIVLSLLGHV